MTKLTRRRTGVSVSSVGNGKVASPVTNRERCLWRKCTGTQGIVGEPLEGDYGIVYGVVKFVFTSLHFEASSTRLLITRRLLLCRRRRACLVGNVTPSISSAYVFRTPLLCNGCSGVAILDPACVATGHHHLTRGPYNCSFSFLLSFVKGNILHAFARSFW